MFEQLIEKLRQDKSTWLQVQKMLAEREVPSKTVLLQAGEISNHAHFIKKGCIRQWFNKDGKDITVQFFFEGQAVASIDSFMNNQPSLFTIETIEPSVILSIGRDSFEKLSQVCPELKDVFRDFIFGRFRNYAQLFLSRIKDSPRERYEDLVANHPEILERVPQHYIASYLGITPVSLSRIRGRK